MSGTVGESRSLIFGKREGRRGARSMYLEVDLPGYPDNLVDEMEDWRSHVPVDGVMLEIEERTGDPFWPRRGKLF